MGSAGQIWPAGQGLRDAGITQPHFAPEMFPPNQRSKPIFRKTAEYDVAYNALHVIYDDTISCNIFNLRCKLCV